MSRTPEDTVYFKFKLRRIGIYYRMMAEKHSHCPITYTVCISDLRDNVTDCGSREGSKLWMRSWSPSFLYILKAN